MKMSLSPKRFECRGSHRINVAQEAIGHFRSILWVFVLESREKKQPHIISKCTFHIK